MNVDYNTTNFEQFISKYSSSRDKDLEEIKKFFLSFDKKMKIYHEHNYVITSFRLQDILVYESVHNGNSVYDVDFKNNSKEDVLNKIKELNFNVDGIKEVYKKGKLVDPIVNPANEGGVEGGNGDDEEVNNLYQELEDEYGISGFIEEEAAKAKIRELNCNRDQIVDWIENNLLNGDN